MYSTLNDMQSKIKTNVLFASTDSQKYPCPSISIPNQNTFNDYNSNIPCYSNREYYNTINNKLAFIKSNPEHLPISLTPDDMNSTNFYGRPLDKNIIESYQKPQDKKLMIHIKSTTNNIIDLHVNSSDTISTIKEYISIKKKINPNEIVLVFNELPLEDSKKLSDYNINNDMTLKMEIKLLPVLDCRFNMREICKQCILLEDHLSHDRKRCHDCCIKHFLALEGLSEEAITLDKEGKHEKILRDIPDQIRYIQNLWYQNPDKNSHLASQKLREIRKTFQENVFNMIFDNKKSCTSGSCKIYK